MNAPASFYTSPENAAALRAAVARVIGTPFFANSEAPGHDGGMDCVHVLNWVYRTSGAIGAVTIPRQTMDHGQHSERSLIQEAFETWPELKERFAPLEIAENPADTALLPGDALCFLAGKVPHHGGIYLEGGDVLHTLKREGVHKMKLTAVMRGESLVGRLVAAFRPLPRT